MDQLYQNAVRELSAAKDEFTTAEQTQMLVERSSTIVRNYGDERMNETFSRLTRFKSSTDLHTRYRKTILAIEIMIKEFGIKSEKDALLVNMTRAFPAPPAEHSYKWIIKNLALVIPVLGAFFYFGYYVGTVKYDKDKIELERVNDNLRDSIISANANHKKSLADTKAESESYRIEKDRENQNIWVTYHKLLSENDSLKKVNAALRKNRKGSSGN